MRLMHDNGYMISSRQTPLQRGFVYLQIGKGPRRGQCVLLPGMQAEQYAGCCLDQNDSATNTLGYPHLLSL